MYHTLPLLLLSTSVTLPSFARQLVLSTSEPSSLPSCLSFRGSYPSSTGEGPTSVYSYNDDDEQDESSACIDTLADAFSAASVIPLDALGEGGYEVVHVSRAALADQSVNTQSEGHSWWMQNVDEHMQGIYRQVGRNIGEGEVLAPQRHRPVVQLQQDNTQQRVFTSQEHASTTDEDLTMQVSQLIATSPLARLLHQSESSAFFAIPDALLPIADFLFPADTVLLSVPSYSLEHPSRQSSSTDEEDYRNPAWLAKSLAELRYTPLVDAIIRDVSPSQLEKHVRHLTNEDGHGGWRTRHSFTDGALRASAWIKDVLEREGGASCEYQHHKEGFAPNVVCTYTGNVQPDELVVIGAHFDTRGTFGQVLAPGGDDDGSGTAMLLSLARLIKAFSIKFERTVVLAAFSGEEQGLWGSKAFSRKLKEEGRRVRWMTQMDMLGYHMENEPLQIAFPDKLSSPTARYLMGNLSNIYVPELQVGTTPACCSDHQSFDEQGFTSTWVFERNGPIADPKYHNSGDTSDRPGYDFEQIAAIGRVVVATLLEVAGFAL